MKRFKAGDRIKNRNGRLGVVVGDWGGRDVRVRYDDGSKDAWIQRQNVNPYSSDPGSSNGECGAPTTAGACVLPIGHSAGRHVGWNATPEPVQMGADDE